MSDNGPVTVREATPGDLDAVLDLWKDLMALHHELDNRHWVRAEDGGRGYREWVAESVVEEDRLLLVAEAEDTVVGFLHGLLKDAPSPMAPRLNGHVTDLAVAEEFRRNGVGSQLVTAAQEWFKKRGANGLTVNVAVRNSNGRSFWGNMGFEPWTQTVWKALD
jgi:GNAT superfamily N-acetyltransferase